MGKGFTVVVTVVEIAQLLPSVTVSVYTGLAGSAGIDVTVTELVSSADEIVPDE